MIRLDNDSKQLQIMTNKADTDVVIKGDTNASTNPNFQDRNIIRFGSDDKSTTCYGELFVPNRGHVELFLNKSTRPSITSYGQIKIPCDQMPVSRGSAVTVNLVTGDINLQRVGLYLITSSFGLYAPTDVSLHISFVMRNAAGTYSTPNYAYGWRVGVTLSHVVYISEPMLLEIRAGSLHSAGLELQTGASVGSQYTNASITFLG
jgi:hypothetical protein